MKSVNRKIRDLEDKILKTPEFGSTKLFITDPVEDALFDKARAIIDAGIAYDNLTPEQLSIIDQATRILWFRALDIFRNIIGGMISKGDKRIQGIFDMWMGYFLQEATTGLNQMWMEGYIFDQKGKSWKQKEKELDEIYGPNSEKWVKVFSRERFEKYIHDFIERGMKPEVRKKLKKKGKVVA